MMSPNPSSVSPCRSTAAAFSVRPNRFTELVASIEVVDPPMAAPEGTSRVPPAVTSTLPVVVT